ncbi:MAG: hypothetical protein ACI9EF_000194 [Pseudohongiellaceae bacterium]|jgi:hypothetical protein
MTAPQTKRREQGHSLLELLVASMMLAIISITIMRLGPGVYSGTSKLTARARSVGELRCAVESMLQDMGGADEVSWMNQDRLEITREQELAEWLGAWVQGPGDAGIQYELGDDGLVRTDLALGTSILVAREIDVFTVDEVGNSQVIVTLGSGEGLAERSLQLIWEN